MVKSNYRTAAKGEYVAVATRRRRRILLAGFFLPYKKFLIILYDINFLQDDV
jgi:hypothetical protein